MMNSKFNLDLTPVRDFFMNFLIPLIAVAIAAAMGFLVLVPSFNSLPSLKSDMEVKAKLEAQLKNKNLQLQKLVDFKQTVDENSELVSNVLVSETLVPQLLTQIDQIAKEAGLTVDKLSYSFSDGSRNTNNAKAQEAPKDPYLTVTVTLGATGNYSQLVAFLEILEGSARLVDVSTYRFTRNEKEQNSVLGATFVLKSPYLFVESNAVTDDPIALDITDKDFLKTIDRVKKLKLYQVSVNNDFLNQTESTESTSSL